MTLDEHVRRVAQLKVQLYSALLALPNEYYEQGSVDSNSNLDMMAALVKDTDIQFVLEQALSNVNNKINNTKSQYE